MSVRIGVDVGGTFTKAVACGAGTGDVVARSVVPTSHGHSLGVARGVAEAVGTVIADVERARLGPVILVSHSTTQAVNALLEGDTAAVGVLGIGRQPDLKRARRRTQVGAIGLAPGRHLQTVHSFLDATNGIRREDVEAALTRLVGEGARSVCVSEAFAVDDAGLELFALEVAHDLGIPACGGHELSGLYGLELRTVTGALNASILPAAIRTAGVVEDSVGGVAPLLVMRGDGGAADLGSIVRHPLLTAFSGPAASVSGALRHLRVGDGVVVEVGGTSTNVSCIKGGRPVLAYVRVLDHVTCVRSIDVRVVGVAGGSLVRLEPRFGRHRIAGIGPRSAHIAGLEYCSFATEDRLIDAQVRLISPVAGDPAHYAILENGRGQRYALTPTCAANALGRVPPGAYAAGSRSAARRGFEALGVVMGCTWEDAARKTLRIAASAIGAVVSEAAREFQLVAPEIIGLGGGAGALVPAVAEHLDVAHRIPPDAEVISSIGDALSLVRAEIERSMTAATGGDIQQLHADAESAAIAAGASPATVRVESSSVPERSALRAVATGAVEFEPGGASGEPAASAAGRQEAAEKALMEHPTLLAATPFYSVFVAARNRWAVVDRHGSVALTGRGTVISGSGADIGRRLADAIESEVRHIGPVAVAPAVRILRGPRLVDLSPLSSADAARDAAMAECSLANGDGVVAFLSRS